MGFLSLITIDWCGFLRVEIREKPFFPTFFYFLIIFFLLFFYIFFLLFFLHFLLHFFLHYFAVFCGKTRTKGPLKRGEAHTTKRREKYTSTLPFLVYSIHLFLQIFVFAEAEAKITTNTAPPSPEKIVDS